MDVMSEPPKSVSEADKVRIIIGVLLAMLLAALDQTIVAPAIPTMGAALGGAHYLSWIVSAYFLTATATTPLYGKVADIHGRRQTLFAAIGLFVAGSVICALAPSMTVLVLGRAVQGLGGGGLMALAQTVIGDLVPPKERGRYAVYISGTWAIASVAGPLLGGFIAQHLHWSVIFWMNLPLAGFAILMTNETLKRLPWHKREHSLDMLGSLLIVTATVCLMLALTWGGSGQAAWGSPSVLGLLAAAVLLALLLVAHLRRTPEPLIPLAVLSNRIVLSATLSVFFAMAAFIGLSVYIPLFLELVLGLSASAAGMALVGYMVGTVVGANIAARTMARITHYKRLPLVGLAISVVALAWLAWRAPVVGFTEVETVLVIAGIGSGAQFPITTVSVQNAVDVRDIGVATSVLAFLRALGSSIGVAVVGAVGSSSGIVVASGEAGAGAAAGIAHMPGGAFTPVFLAASLSLALGFLMLLRMPERPLRGRGPVPPPPE